MPEMPALHPDKHPLVDNQVVQSLAHYYRVPLDSLGSISGAKPSSNTGFFQFGPGTVCYGESASGVAHKIENSGHYDAFEHIRNGESEIHLPFNPGAVIENIRRERYEGSLAPSLERIVSQDWMLAAYYSLRGILPVTVRRKLQRIYLSGWKDRPFPAWPVDFTVDTLHEKLLRLSMEASGRLRAPFIWFWPDGASNCLILTHDVETLAGRDFTSQLIDLDESYGFRASFQVVPESRYQVPDAYVESIRNRGYEFNVHDLNHDGLLYRERGDFLRRAKKINEYCRRYGARGFRAGSMYRNLDWYEAFEFSYDMSVPNVAHLEPKRGGCCTVFPFFVGNILEIPLTTSEDYSVFHILNEDSIALWKKQLELIRQRNGLMSVLAHPDYLIDSRTRKLYELLLDHLRELLSGEKIWAALPGEVDQWWRARSKMNLIQRDGNWVVEGPEKERARIAYAVIEGDRVVYDLPS
jgi:hypothetical protein